VRWPDLETKYPDDGASTLSGLLTHGARVALGMPARPRDRKDALRRISGAILTGWAHRTDFAAKAGLALLGALEGEWDLVGDATGGALPTRVTIHKTYGFDLVKLARHLAAVAYAKLPATHAVAAITELRERFVDGDSALEPRSAVLATYLFARDIVRAEDPVSATRRFLEGEQLEIEATRGFAGPADGEDPRVKIFERFAAELSDDKAITTLLGKHAITLVEEWGRHVEKPRLAFDDLVIRAYVARIPLPDRWERLVDPVVHAWLGGETPAIERRFADLALLRTARHVVADWEDALPSLIAGTKVVFVDMVETKKLPRFKPGQFFKDDARKLIRYLASAIAAGATEADVLPAWFDFLSRRSPATTPRLTGETAELRWKHLLTIEAAIARIAGRPRGEVGRALQQHVSGA
jgi:hypothetical protein